MARSRQRVGLFGLGFVILGILPCLRGIGFPVAGSFNGSPCVLEFVLEEFWSGANPERRALEYLFPGL
mgnify:CR=1 FL=1